MTKKMRAKVRLVERGTLTLATSIKPICHVPLTKLAIVLLAYFLFVVFELGSQASVSEANPLFSVEKLQTSPGTSSSMALDITNSGRVLF